MLERTIRGVAVVFPANAHGGQFVTPFDWRPRPDPPPANWTT